MSDAELEAGHNRWSRRTIQSAIVLVATLIFEALLLYRFSQGKSGWETGLFIAADLVLAFAVSGEIVGDMLADKYRSAADARSNQRLGEAIERAAKLEKEAAELRIETERLKAATEWRGIPTIRLRKMVGVLDTLKAASLCVWYIDGDTESQAFASLIAHIFEAFDWRAELYAVSVVGHVPFGLRIPAQMGDAESVAAGVQSAFAAAEIEFTMDKMPAPERITGRGVPGPYAQVFVGPKRPVK